MYSPSDVESPAVPWILECSWQLSCVQAPEVFIGNYGLEADIWASGMMMYQLLVRPSDSQTATSVL